VVTEKGLKTLSFELSEAQTAREFQRVADRCDAFAKPLVIQKQCIETKLSDLQSLRILADNGKIRSTK
jgi:hypothetical protein